MGLFDRNKMSKDAGEWAATAMGCMVFADGSANEAEVSAARGQVTTNPVLKNSIGSKRADELFTETIDAVGAVVGAMLPTYETKLAALATEIDDAHEKNFCLATVVAVALGDRHLSDNEYAMLQRFRDMLGATIPLPQPGDGAPAQYRQVAAVDPQEAAVTPVKEDAVVSCPNCQQATKLYEGYGHWCASCQQYAEVAQSEGVAASQAAGAAEAQTRKCPSCGQPTKLYEGYGHWCDGCRQYALA